jgi:prevent-host-death family protein
VKSSLAELHRDTAKVMKPVINGKKTLIITNHGEPCAKIVPLPEKPDRKRALAILRSMSALELPPRK